MNGSGPRPPRLLVALLGLCRLGSQRVEIEADLAELFAERAVARGLSSARWRYLIDVLSVGWRSPRERREAAIAGDELSRSYRTHLTRPAVAWLPLLGQDLRWAFRGVRVRGSTAVLSIGLLAVALASSTLVFSSADALIFNRVPYPEPARLVSLERAVQPGVFEELRRQTDLFGGISAHQPAVTFVTTTTEPLQVETEYVTPGLFETLGVLPRWGRPLVETDRTSISPTIAVIDAGLATDLFGSPETAVGKFLETTDRRLTVVGVMPPGFRFPNGRVRIWRALDHTRLTEDFGSMPLIARLAAGRSMADASAVLAARLPEFARPPTPEEIQIGVGGHGLVPYTFGQAGRDRVTTLSVLLGAALCLLLAACANVASLELAAGVRRAHVFAIQRALGASRGSLARSVCLEGAFLVGIALALALALATLAASSLTSILPDTITLGGINAIDVDGRALAFLAAVAAVVWAVASLPLALYAFGARLPGVLKGDNRGATASRAGTRARQLITTSEVALAVVLLVGALLYLRTYAAFLSIPTGMDSHGVVRLVATTPPETFSNTERRELADQLLTRLAGLPGVISASRVLGGVPPGNAFTMRPPVELDDGRVTAPVAVSAYTVDPTFFRTMGIATVRGRFFDADSSTTDVVVTETLARFLWADRDPIGRSFRLNPRQPWLTAVAVVPHVRTDRDDLRGPSPTAFSIFRLPEPPRVPRPDAPPASAGPPVNAPSGAVYGFFTILVRLHDASQAGSILAAARDIDGRARYAVESLDAIYARRYADTRMATSIVSGFAGIAFLVAVAGVFGVMTFLVSSRTREVGIRMALGADGRQVSRMVLGSSLKLILLGVGIGLGAAVAASRYIESQLFGVTPHDPLTLAAVSAVVILAATVATWHPARRAARVDPVIALRTE